MRDAMPVLSDTEKVEDISSSAIMLYQARAHAAALDRFHRALILDPARCEAMRGQACTLDKLGRWHDALAAHRRACLANPRDAVCQVNFAMALLHHGAFAEGWERFERRFEHRDYSSLASHASLVGNRYRRLKPGMPLDGVRLLVFTEQGLGDAVQFARYVPLLARRGAVVTLVCPPSLRRLFESLDGVQTLLAPPAEAGTALNLSAVPHDRHVAVMSLPWTFGTRLATIPAEIPYLHVPPRQAAAWGGRLPAADGPRVGLAWAGNPRHHQPWASWLDQERSLPPALLAPLAGVPGVTWVNLQKHHPDRPAGDRPVLPLIDLMDEAADFADTAAIIAHLDLVITVDTSVAHVAAALGKPVWVLSRFDGCWRWLLDREDSPWYPDIRLFRQPAPGEWAAVVARVAAALAGMAAEGRLR